MNIATYSADVHCYKPLEDSGKLNFQVNASTLCDEKGGYQDALSEAIAQRGYFSDLI